MSKQPKDTFRHRLSMFLFKGPKTGNLPSTTGLKSKSEEFIITEERLKDVSPESQLNHRMKAIKDLCDVVTTKRLEDHAIESLWVKIADLLEPHAPTECRQLVLGFIKATVMGQYKNLNMMRAHFFTVIANHTVFEDLPMRLQVFKALSDHGKDLLYFEEDTGPFLHMWMPDIISYGKTSEFLTVLVNVIKFNSCYLDDDIVAGLVKHTCLVCTRTISEVDIEQALAVLDAVVCYSNLPTESLHHFITSLCRMLSVKTFCEASWKLMRKMLGTHLGHSGIYEMCCILQDRQNVHDPKLLKGAVFFIGMALWGSRRVSTLKHNPTSVLPSFKQALACKDSAVAYEVGLTIQRLVKKYGRDLQLVTWDSILEIVAELFGNIEVYYNCHETLAQEIQGLLTSVEQLYEKGIFNGSATDLFDVVERFARIRPVSSVLLLVSYRAQAIHPTREEWIHNMHHLMENYFKNEKRTVIREKALNVLSYVLSSTSHLYEEDLIEVLILPYLSHINEDPDTTVRNAAVQLLVDVAMDCQNQQCVDILAILEKVVMKPMVRRQVETHDQPMQDEKLVDIRTAVLGLLDLFTIKLMKLPSSHAVMAFEILVKHMQSHYSNRYTSKLAGEIRCREFHCLMQLRADNHFRLGLPNKENVLRFSPYVLCDHRYDDALGSISPPSMATSPTVDRSSQITVIPFFEAFKTISTCLKYETDWRVLKQVLSDLASALQNKTLMIAANADLNRFCDVIGSLINERSYLNKLQNKPINFTRVDYFHRVFNVIIATVSYHTLLNIKSKNDIVHCLEMGLKLRCAQQCVDGLTICMNEMQSLMMKLLPGILQHLSTLSATKTMAIPVLEFLSGIIWLPILYSNFVEEQYMAIFAIALHYTNPSKFSVYEVSLAHHIISMWFIKCRLPFRREFVRFIAKGLQANTLIPAEDRRGFHLRRSSSLNEKKGHIVIKPSMDEKKKLVLEASAVDMVLQELHLLLTETCMDMMARYTFSSCTTQPKRLPAEEFLFSGAQTQSWLLGNKIITITTSGGSSRMKNNGICDKCDGLIRREQEAAKCTPMAPKTADENSTFRLTPLSGSVKSETSDFLNVSIQSINDASDADGGGRTVFQEDDSSLHEHSMNHKHSGKGSRSDSALAVPSHVSSGCQSNPNRSSSDTVTSGHKMFATPLMSPRPSTQYDCTCWCQGWAEIYIRRPTGNMSWTMRIQNQGKLVQCPQELPLIDISSLLLANLKLKPEDWKSPEVIDVSKEEQELPLPETATSKKVSTRLKHICHMSIAEENVSFDDMQPAVTIVTPHVIVEPPDNSDVPQPEFLDVSFDEPGLGKSYEKPELGVSPLQKEGLSKLDLFNKKPKFSKMAAFLNLVDKDITDINQYDVTSFHYDLQKSNSCPEIFTLLSSVEEEEAMNSNQVQAQTLKQPRSYDACTLEELLEKGDESTLRQRSSAYRGSLPKLSDSTTDLADLGKEEDDGIICPEDAIARSQLIPTKTDQNVQVNLSRSPTACFLGRTEKDGIRFSKPSKSVVTSSGSYHLQQSQDDSLTPRPRPRGHTISSGNTYSTGFSFNQQESERSKRSGSFVGRDSDNKHSLNPSFVFLQLYHSPFFGEEQDRPLTLHTGQVVQRAIKVLDRIPPYDAHKIGVVYVGHNQVNNETAILSNVYGSPRYVDFLRGLGTLISLTDVNPAEVYMGGLDHSGADGKFAYSWQDDMMQVIFHVATLMPNRESDPHCNGKKLHIGNDYVTIVYNHSEQDYILGTIKGQFNFVELIIKPLDNETNLVTVQAKPEIKEMLGNRGPKMISDERLAMLVRQMALHANLASLIHQSQVRGTVSETYTSNWLERLRQIKRIRGKTLKESVGDISPTRHRSTARSNSVMEDFSDYV